MTQNRIVAIVGATGAQGGGLARAILDNPGAGFAVRAITRNPTSPASRQLAASGAEVVTGDVGDLATLTEALRGAWGAFFVTNFWAHCCPATEKSDARNMAAGGRDGRASVQFAHAPWRRSASDCRSNGGEVNFTTASLLPRIANEPKRSAIGQPGVHYSGTMNVPALSSPRLREVGRTRHNSTRTAPMPIGARTRVTLAYAGTLSTSPAISHGATSLTMSMIV